MAAAMQGEVVQMQAAMQEALAKGDMAEYMRLAQEFQQNDGTSPRATKNNRSKPVYPMEQNNIYKSVFKVTHSKGGSGSCFTSRPMTFS